MSLRPRLFVVSLATLAVGMGAFLIAGNVLLAQRVHAEASSIMHANIEAQLSALDVSADGVEVRETVNDGVLDRRSWVFDGKRLVERPPDAAPELNRKAIALGQRATQPLEADGPNATQLRVEPIYAPGSRSRVGAIVVVLSTASLEDLQKVVLLGTVILAVVMLLAGALAIRRALNGALRPVAQMTASAQAWGAQDLDRRFALGPPRDELTALAATLDELLARIAASRRHEQRFAGEMAHELRTPLAGLRLQAELALRATGPQADVEQRRALEHVVVQATRLSDAIDALLAVARQQTDPKEGTVDLTELVRDFEDVEVLIDEGVPLAEGDPDVVRRALTPLVENARRHARTSISLAVSNGAGHVRVVVRDDGPGLDPALGERAFDPGTRGASAANDGAGLGLPLARRLARSCGGDVVIGAGPGGCFVLELPALGPRHPPPFAA